jgi:hypothetical protein
MDRHPLERASWIAGIVSAIIAVIVWLAPEKSSTEESGPKTRAPMKQADDRGTSTPSVKQPQTTKTETDGLLKGPLKVTDGTRNRFESVQRHGHEVVGIEYEDKGYSGSLFSGDFIYSLIVHLKGGSTETLTIKLPNTIQHFTVSPDNRFAAWTLILGGEIYLFDSTKDNSSTISHYDEGFHNEKGLVWIDNTKLKIWESDRTKIYEFGNNKEIL